MSVLRTHGPHVAKIGIQPPGEPIFASVQWDNPILLSLPLPNSDVGAVGAGDDVIERHRRHLADAQPGPQHELNQEAVAAGQVAAKIRCSSVSV